MAIREVNKTTGDTSRIVAGGTLWADSPIGSILPYGGATAPSGWMICDGTAISRTTYSELFAVIGTSFGAGDGSTTFNLPDLREATTKGVGLTGKSNNHYDSDGVALGEFINDRMQDHGHSSGGTSVGNGSYIASASASVGNVMSSSGVAGTYRSGATTEVKAVGVNYIIKAKMVAMPSDFMSKVDEAVEEVNTPVTTDISSYLTPNQSSATIQSAKLIQSGKLCQVKINMVNCTLNKQASSSLHITSTNDVPKPKIELDFISVYFKTGVDTVGHGKVDTSGEFVVYANEADNGTSGLSVWLTATYICE